MLMLMTASFTHNKLVAIVKSFLFFEIVQMVKLDIVLSENHSSRLDGEQNSKNVFIDSLRQSLNNKLINYTKSYQSF